MKFWISESIIKKHAEWAFNNNVKAIHKDQAYGVIDDVMFLSCIPVSPFLCHGPKITNSRKHSSLLTAILLKLLIHINSHLAFGGVEIPCFYFVKTTELIFTHRGDFQ